MMFSLLLLLLVSPIHIVAEQQVVNLLVSSADIEYRAIKNQTDRYTLLNPNVRVNLVILPLASSERLPFILSALQAGSVDALVVDVVWPGLMADQLVDLRPFIPTQQLTDFLPSAIQSNTVQGKLTAIPFWLDYGMFYYRIDLMQKYNLTNQDGQVVPPQTWDELERMSSIIQAGERVNNPLFNGFLWNGNPNEGQACNLLEFVGSASPDLSSVSYVESNGRISFNNPAFKQTLQRVKSWIGTIAPANSLEFDNPTELKTFVAGNAAFMRLWVNGAQTSAVDPFLRGRVGVAPLPHAADLGARSAGALGGWQLAVPIKSPNKLASINLVNWLTSKEEMIFRATNFGFIGSYRNMSSLLPSSYCSVAAHPNLCDLPSDLNILARPSGILQDKYTAFSSSFVAATKAYFYQNAPLDDTLNTLECDTYQLMSKDITTYPQHCIQTITVDTNVYYAITAVSIIAMLMFAIFAVLSAAKSSTPVFKRASPLFLQMILAGGMVACATVIVHGASPITSSISTLTRLCNVEPWLFSIAVTLIFGSLLTKVYRLNLIFNNPKLQKIKATDQEMVRIIVIIAVVETAINIAWNTVGTQRMETQLAVVNGQRQQTYACTGNNYTMWLGLAITIKIIPIILGAYYSVRTRNVVTAFNESRVNMFAIYNILFVAVIVGPLVFSHVSPSATLMYVIFSVGVLWCVCVSLGAIFLPKLYVAYIRPEQNHTTMRSQHTENTTNAGTSSLGKRHSISDEQITQDVKLTTTGTIPLTHHQAMEQVNQRIQQLLTADVTHRASSSGTSSSSSSSPARYRFDTQQMRHQLLLLHQLVSRIDPSDKNGGSGTGPGSARDRASFSALKRGSVSRPNGVLPNSKVNSGSGFGNTKDDASKWGNALSNSPPLQSHRSELQLLPTGAAAGAAARTSSFSSALLSPSLSGSARPASIPTSPMATAAAAAATPHHRGGSISPTGSGSGVATEGGSGGLGALAGTEQEQKQQPLEPDEPVEQRQGGRNFI